MWSWIRQRSWHSSLGNALRRGLLFVELGERPGFSEIKTHGAHLRPEMAEDDGEKLLFFAKLANVHGSANQILFLVVLARGIDVPVNDQRPVVFAWDDKHAVSANRNRGIGQDEIGLGK